jgi:hypothetical protein
MPITEPRPCPACGGRDSRSIGDAGGFRVERCRACRSAFTARLPTAPEATDYGRYYHAANLDVPAFVHSRLERLVSSLASYRRLNAWLDVGCGAGALMEAGRARAGR